MWIYIITWTLVQINHVPCQPEKDEFGRKHEIEYSLDCIARTTEKHKDTVGQRKQAFQFYNRALSDKGEVDYTFEKREKEIQNVKIDSVFIKL